MSLGGLSVIEVILLFCNLEKEKDLKEKAGGDRGKKYQWCLRTMDIRIVKELVEEVLTVCKNDDTGVTFDLLDSALRAGAEIGMTEEELETIIDEA